MDFTLKIYQELLAVLKTCYAFQTFEDYIGKPEDKKLIILRHDVDKCPGRSLAFAGVQAKAGVRGTYYFRAVPESWDEGIIREIRDLGHEVGYHYESLTTCHGDVDKAYEDFCRNLERLRRLVPVATICMHGSPRSPWDSKDIWTKYDYRELGIIAEPYLDIDFSNLFYVTDTGRRWDGYRVSVRDKIPELQGTWERNGWVYHSTSDIIRAVKAEEFPERVMVTNHPQRWTDCRLAWMQELFIQGLKNQIKRFIVK
ncbi:MULTISPECIES: hypothetical protein [Sanguibacteroides]|uniref:Polysaccharide deacetylase n=1 Tax=Sanguibacteroides justesenii TaxID=1547597 RepID=A0AB34R3X5_9PORP|nr:MULTISPECIES: hypothetical protein [Sanguibacteroides]KIO46308.1 hypothetical protein IE90_05815 [Sanguibacteroides justesenii]